MSGLRLRIFSAVIAVLVMVGTWYFGREAGLYTLCLIVVTIAAWEYGRIVFTKKTFHSAFTLLCVALSLLISLSSIDSGIVFAMATGLLFLLILLRTRESKSLESFVRNQSFGILGLVYCGLMAGYALKIFWLPHGTLGFIMFLAIVFGGDSAAFFAGSRFGKRKLFEVVSPKKTVEGAIGGLFASAAVGALAAYLLNFPLEKGVLVGGLTGTFGQAGDLFESAIKRTTNVKDSGKIMPGHGGMLDRIDGVLFSAPVFYLLMS